LRDNTHSVNRLGRAANALFHPESPAFQHFLEHLHHEHRQSFRL
jgi:hypothetical protein